MRPTVVLALIGAVDLVLAAVLAVPSAATIGALMVAPGLFNIVSGLRNLLSGSIAAETSAADLGLGAVPTKNMR